MTKIETQMRKILATYTGPVFRCPPGKARGAEMPKGKDRPQRWLNRAERARIAKRNAFVRECHRLND
jgi:hypothetical protein